MKENRKSNIQSGKLVTKKKDAFLTSLLWSLDTVRGVKENMPAIRKYNYVEAVFQGCYYYWGQAFRLLHRRLLYRCLNIEGSTIF